MRRIVFARMVLLMLLMMILGISLGFCEYTSVKRTSTMSFFVFGDEVVEALLVVLEEDLVEGLVEAHSQGLHAALRAAEVEGTQPWEIVADEKRA